MDLVLINPGGRKRMYQGLSDLAAIEPPIWAGMIATFIRKHGFDVAIIDANAEELCAGEVAAHVVEIAPLLAAVVVYGHNPVASTQVMPEAGAICTALKERAPLIRRLLVGGHVAALPMTTLLEEDATFTCGGEGPYTILDLLHYLSRDQPLLSEVRGIWWRGVGPVGNVDAPNVVDLDGEMPGVAWDLLPMDKYRAHNHHCFGFLDQRQPYAALYTSLGCPYHCSFCCIHAPFKRGGGKRYRMWSPQSVIEQIDTLVNEYGARNIRVADELFMLNRDHVLGVADLIIERGYDLNLFMDAHVKTVDQEMLERLRRAGFRWCTLAPESASEKVRAGVQKIFGLEEIYRAAEMIHAAGFNIMGNFIFGLPEDTLETMEATLELAVDLGCEFVNFYSAMAYPGSELRETAIREGWPLPETWAGYSQHAVDTLPLPTKYVSGLEVLRFRDYAFKAYFTRPAYLNMIEQKFGPETVQHIREMTSRKLERRYDESADSSGRTGQETTTHPGQSA